MADPVLNAAILLRDALNLAMIECDAPPCRISLSPTSATPIDICCDCGDGDGQAWVSVINAKPLFSQASGFTPCGFETEVLFVMGISRCAYTVDDQGEPPTAAQLDENATRLLTDRQILLTAIQTYWVAELQLDKQDYTIGETDIHPVRGGCMVITQELRYRYMCAGGPCA